MLGLSAVCRQHGPPYSATAAGGGIIARRRRALVVPGGLGSIAVALQIPVGYGARAARWRISRACSARRGQARPRYIAGGTMNIAEFAVIAVGLVVGYWAVSKLFFSSKN